MYEPDEEQPKDAPLPFRADPVRLRRESRSEAPIGSFIRKAAEEADNRVLRARKGPPPTEEELSLISASAHEAAQLFSRVIVTDLEFGEREEYRIVPHDEGNLAEGRISIGSPLARAMLMEYPGAVIEVKTPGGPRLYRILQVNP